VESDGVYLKELEVASIEDHKGTTFQGHAHVQWRLMDAAI